ncbi:DEAD/DEAH box helicase family protein [Tomitella biformata]|uniref:DEAD/DEAH box helicase family protein n=1 Tax=Tomitella biformata TaxID=630403 RepID=UPI0004674F4B|nr:DEAD/DEAH box helicase family protein [Tomitella biformata]
MPGRARRKTTATRKPAARKPASKKPSAAQDLPEASAGQRIWVLDVPYRAPAPGAKYYKGIKAYAYVGTDLPTELATYANKPYSYARWAEDELNGGVGLGTAGMGAVAVAKQPRQEQLEAAAAIVAAHAAGHRGFLLADDPGVGKTGSAVLAAREILDAQIRDGKGSGTALITVDRPAQITIPAWRDALAAFGDGGHRWLIMSPDQLKKLLGGNGRPKHHFDVIINDEAQQFRHLTAQRTQYQRRINKLSAEPAKAPFVITVTATPGHHPGVMRSVWQCLT